jgi:hypothetical protein
LPNESSEELRRRARRIAQADVEIVGVGGERQAGLVECVEDDVDVG